MVKLDQFTIHLEKEDGIFYPGDMMVGFVYFETTERFKINNVHLEIDGSARVIWTEGSGQYRRTFQADEHYLSHKVVFLEKKPEEDELYVGPGQRIFRFEFVLPDNLPTSFEHEYGRIRYTINATIGIPWAIDKHTTKTFSVINRVDLNKFGNLNQPKEVKDTKTLCCGPWKSQPINTEFSVKKTAYVPGETIECHVTLNNRSASEIKVLTVSLMEQVFLKAEGGVDLTKQVDREVVSARYTHHIRQNTTTEWPDIKLEIPPVCASSNHKGHIIEIKYALVLHFEASGINSTKTLSIPLIIGTEPYESKLKEDEAANKKKPKLTYKHSLFMSSSRVPHVVENMRGDVVQSDAKTFAPHYPYFHHGSF